MMPTVSVKKDAFPSSFSHLFFSIMITQILKIKNCSFFKHIIAYGAFSEYLMQYCLSNFNSLCNRKLATSYANIINKVTKYWPNACRVPLIFCNAYESFFPNNVLVKLVVISIYYATQISYNPLSTHGSESDHTINY